MPPRWKVSGIFQRTLQLLAFSTSSSVNPRELSCSGQHTPDAAAVIVLVDHSALPVSLLECDGGPALQVSVGVAEKRQNSEITNPFAKIL